MVIFRLWSADPSQMIDYFLVMFNKIFWKANLLRVILVHLKKCLDFAEDKLQETILGLDLAI